MDLGALAECVILILLKLAHPIICRLRISPRSCLEGIVGIEGVVGLIIRHWINNHKPVMLASPISRSWIFVALVCGIGVGLLLVVVWALRILPIHW